LKGSSRMGVGLMEGPYETAVSALQNGATGAAFSREAQGLCPVFYGYGESLIDYNARTNRIGIGIMLTDWL